MDSRIIYSGDNGFSTSSAEALGKLRVEAVRLLNFKAFVDSGWIELGKINLLLGKNSIGKSSITQALQMLMTSYDKMEHGAIQPGLLALEDGFGSFFDIKNNSSDSQSFSILFRLAGRDAKYVYDVTIRDDKSESEIMVSLKTENDTIFSVRGANAVENIFFAKLASVDEASSDAVLFMNAVNTIKEFAAGLGYISPIRNVPRRQFSVSGTMASSVGFRGDNTYDMLFYLSQIKGEVPEAIRAWLEKFGYELVWKSQGENRNEGSFYLRNLKTDNLTNIVDNGFGISQSLPIVLEMTMKESGLLVIDSPEAHLQAPIESEFADIIVMARREKTSIMLETGSEQIIMRIRKLVAEGKISPEDVSCYFIDENEGDNRVKCVRLNISADGIMNSEDTSFSEFFSDTAMDLMEIKKIQFERARKKLDAENSN